MNLFSFKNLHLCYNVNIKSLWIDEMSSMLKKNIGKIIKKRRELLKLEQVDVQEYTDIGATTISTLEQGKANITIDKLEAITDLLGLEIVIKVKG